MKIIDKDLKIFGRLHIFDFFVILFMVFLVFAMFFVVPKKNRKTNEALEYIPSIHKDNWCNVKVRSISPIIPEIIPLIDEGDAIISPTGTKVATITGIVSIKDGLADKTRDVVTKNVILNLLLRVRKEDGRYFWGTMEIKTGKPFNFKTAEYDMYCEIIDIGDVVTIEE